MVCTTCTTSRGYPNWSAEAWKAGQSCQGPGAGQTHCDFVADADSAGRHGPRWKCCCAPLAQMTTRPRCFDSDDASGGAVEGGIRPHPGRLFEEVAPNLFIFSQENATENGCEHTPCREGKPWDQYYSNSGINPKKRGRTRGVDPDGTPFAIEDTCRDDKTLIEYFCANAVDGRSLLRSMQIQCSSRCRDGACVE